MKFKLFSEKKKIIKIELRQFDITKLHSTLKEIKTRVINLLFLLKNIFYALFLKHTFKVFNSYINNKQKVKKMLHISIIQWKISEI